MLVRALRYKHWCIMVSVYGRHQFSSFAPMRLALAFFCNRAAHAIYIPYCPNTQLVVEICKSFVRSLFWLILLSHGIVWLGGPSLPKTCDTAVEFAIGKSDKGTDRHACYLPSRDASQQAPIIIFRI